LVAEVTRDVWYLNAHPRQPLGFLEQRCQPTSHKKKFNLNHFYKSARIL
jgi:hypothetical protein